MLQLGPFHWISTLPRSSRKTSPLLKLSQESATCHREMREFGKVGRTRRAAGDSHSHGKAVPGDVRRSLQWLLILLALSSPLSTVASLQTLKWGLENCPEIQVLEQNEIPKWSIRRAGSSFYLCGWHVLLALDMKKTLDVVHVGLHVLESWSHSSLLVAVE